MHPLKLSFIPLALAILATSSTLHAAPSGREVVVVFNSSMPESRAVAEHYAMRRNVPENQVMGFDLSTDEAISRTHFQYNLQEPLFEKLVDEGLFKRKMDMSADTLQYKVVDASIRYLVLCYGVPLKIKPEPDLKEPLAEQLNQALNRNEAAVDSELTWLTLRETKPMLAGPMANSFQGTTNSAALHPTNNILMVARLDGPTPEIAKGLVDKAISAETNGFWGRAYFDLRGIDSGNFKDGEVWLQNAADISRSLGFEVVVDRQPETFGPFFPMSHIAFYAGWYDGNVSGPFTRPEVEFMPGAIAYHLHSFSAASLRTSDRHWVGPLLAKGATASIGYAYEPYLGGTIDVGIFAARLIYQNFTFGEAVWAAEPVLSWQTVVIGDPLYQPYKLSAPDIHAQLEERGSPLADWSHLRVVNLNIAKEARITELVDYLENIPATSESPILLEKLGDLYQEMGKPSSSALTYEKAFKQADSPLQRQRLALALTDKYLKLDQPRKSWEWLESFNALVPNYTPEKPILERRLALAEKLDQPDLAAELRSQLDSMSKTAQEDSTNSNQPE